MNQRSFHKLVSGENKGFSADVLRFLLRLASAGYSTAVGFRNLLYSNGWLKTHRTNAIVISVGNITTGGTGKTPLVIWLCNLLKKKNIDCAVLTRGYKSIQNSELKNQNYSDEPAIIAQSCPQAKVIIDPDRVAGAAEAVGKFGVKALVLDDGFQHRRLERDIDIVTIDATCPFGYGKVLPAGLLREPLHALKRADAAVITRCDQVARATLEEIEGRLYAINPHIIIARALHSPVYIKLADGTETDVGRLKGKKIFAFCGIGNPDSFFDTIRGLGADITGSQVFDDHYHYASQDLIDIRKKAELSKADLILTTQKDWTKIKLPALTSKAIPFAYLAIELKFISSQDKITQLIEGALAGKI